jgi:hypothetical protein
MVPVRFISEAVGYNVVWVGDSKNILVSDKNIFEWRFGGHKNQAPYQNFDYRYVNGEKTEAVRYLDTYWTLAQNTGVVDVSSMNEGEYKAKCKTIPYEDLLRQPSYYQNNDVYYRGRVIDVFEIDSYFATTVLIVQVTKLNFAYSDNIYVILPYTTSYLAYDIIDIYGKSMGTTEYKGETIPYVSSAYINMADITVETDKTLYYANTNIPMLENVTGLRYDHADGNKYYYFYYDMPYGFRSDYMTLLDKNGFDLTSSLELDDSLIYKKGKFK